MIFNLKQGLKIKGETELELDVSWNVKKLNLDIFQLNVFVFFTNLHT